MNKTLEYIIKKYKIDLNKRSPFNIDCGRWEKLPKLFKELKFKVGAEIGVLKGQYSELLCKTIPGLKMYCIDKWKKYPTYRDFRSQDTLDEYERVARKVLARYDCIIMKAWSMDAVKVIDDSSLDFVWIDANHEFQQVTNDIAEWSKKVRPGGIVAGHDFFRSANSKLYVQVKDVVQGWTYAYGIHPWFVLKDERTVSRGISWMWVKE
ncbi:MAG: class I SAM-dependent methyltransferase [Candidatus Pacearchaeota archaeon]